MPDDLASSNVNRSYSLSATSIAIFTFTLVFLYPRSLTGEINSLLFQGTLVLMGVATFTLGLASVQYYGASLAGNFDEAKRARYARGADIAWLVGYALMFVAPAMILFTVGLWLVGTIWFALWLMALMFGLRHFPGFLTRGVKSPTP
jgi:hypothetical protein